MPQKLVYSIGVIRSVAGNRASVVLTHFLPPDRLNNNAPAVLWSRQPGNNATAKLRGHISEIRDGTAVFTVVATMIDPHWPKGRKPLQPDGWVYLAVPDSFMPDPAFTIDEAELRKWAPARETP